MTLDTLRTWTPADALRHAGAKPSKRRDRWTPCPLCGGADVWAGRVAWTCHHCGKSLDAVGTGRALSDGTIAGALAWAGLEDAPMGRPRTRVVPFVPDWTPVWLWPTNRKPPQFWSPGLPWGGEGPAPMEVDPHAAAWARLRRLEPGGPWRLPRARLALASAREGPVHVRVAWRLEAVAGREAVGMGWDSLLDWRAG